jgi:hypothetical protein
VWHGERRRGEEREWMREVWTNALNIHDEKIEEK